ncbi:MAG: c-type cytochrome biogenesis protein CcmI [Gammaproteobacteria bacterium]|nr:c-type cytochrome biogenesis protein CcmI [Gammaproteobacteria bacterium]
MNISFWGGSVVLLLIAVVMVIFPLLRVRKSRSLAYKTSNIQLHEEKIKELDIDLQEDRIDQEAYKLARQELDRELLGDTPIESKVSAAKHYTPAPKKRPVVALVIAVLLPALSLLVYDRLGMNASTAPETAAENKALPSVEEMVLELEQYLQVNPGELQDWVMLGRAYKHSGRYGEAVNAFSTASSIEQNPQVMLEHAEAIALANGEKFNEESHALILKALEIEPYNGNALWFAGVAEYQFGNYRQSIEYLMLLSEAAVEDPEVDRSIRIYIEKAREQLIAAGETVAGMEELLPPRQSVPAENSISLQVSVEVSEEARKNFAADAVVFIYAKAQQGPKMPLAAQRLRLSDLPASVVLDESMGMVEGMNLSAFNQVVVSARLSRSGGAIAESGDYIGEMTVDDVAATGNVTIRIDRRVP